MKNGKLIVMEGACDGIGKTTQYYMLGRRLTEEGQSVCRHHFPSYGTYHGKPVEMYLKGEFGMHASDTSPYFVNGLYAMDRGCAWYGGLKEKYEEGTILLLDRYTTSSILYQSASIEDRSLKKDFIDYVCDFEYNKIGIKKPDQVVFLYAPFDLVAEMRRKRITNDGIENDIFERDTAYMRKIYDNGLFIADYLSWDVVDCSKDGSMCSKEEIHEKVYSLVKTKNKI